MDMRGFNQTWEIEYICERVKRITESVESGNYEYALDYLRMIKEKAEAAEYLIKNRNINSSYTDITYGELSYEEIVYLGQKIGCTINASDRTRLTDEHLFWLDQYRNNL